MRLIRDGRYREMMKITSGMIGMVLVLVLSGAKAWGQAGPVVARPSVDVIQSAPKTYRVTYTLTETDGAKRIGTQHFTVVVVTGGKTTLKQGSKVPVSTGVYNAGTSGTQTQFTYLDVGLNIDASLEESVDGVRLNSKVEQSTIAESAIGPQDPIVRQTVLMGTSILTLGKPLVLGSLDVPGSTRHMDVEVVMEAVK